MSPWIDDPDTGTSHYERPKGRAPKKASTLADLASAFNAAQQLNDTGRELDDPFEVRVRVAGDGLGPLLKGERYTRITVDRTTELPNKFKEGS